MSLINALFSTIWTRVLMLGAALAAAGRLIGMAVASPFGRGGTAKSRLIANLTAPAGQRVAFDLLRAVLPNLVLRRRFVTAYDNGGTAVVTRFDDVKDVLARDQDFEVVYGPRMMQITGGQNFFLGMQNTAEYTRDVSNMRLAVRRADLAAVIRPFASRRAADLVAAAKGRIDVPQDLTLRVPVQLLDDYFGTPGPSEREMIAWTTDMFWYLFIDLAADPELDARVVAEAAQCCAYLDAVIKERKAHPSSRDDVLNRCLAMQAAGLPGMDDLGIRNNLVGLVIGAVPTTSKAAVQALDQLLDRPEALAGAQDAARADDDASLARYIFEALRFNPVNPVIYRRATRDTIIAGNTLRARKIPRSTMVLAANYSAMFDRLKLAQPERFRTDRPWDDYILWGDGLHTCFGAHINWVLIPAILKPLLQRQGLRRAAGPAGQIDTQKTPFPVHLSLEFEGG
jgi:cytochrome P450